MKIGTKAIGEDDCFTIRVSVWKTYTVNGNGRLHADYRGHRRHEPQAYGGSLDAKLEGAAVNLIAGLAGLAPTAISGLQHDDGSKWGCVVIYPETAHAEMALRALAA